jgi:hypothetical protein
VSSRPARRFLEGGLAGDGRREGRAREARLLKDECGTHTESGWIVFGTSYRLGPPMVVGEARDQLGLIEQLYAPVQESLLDLLDLLEEPVG